MPFDPEHCSYCQSVEALAKELAAIGSLPLAEQPMARLRYRVRQLLHETTHELLRVFYLDAESRLRRSLGMRTLSTDYAKQRGADREHPSATPCEVDGCDCVSWSQAG